MRYSRPFYYGNFEDLVYILMFEKPDGITFETPNVNTVIIKGINKQEVGQVAANIRELRKPEPYKGKGIKYADEYIRRKVGKSIGLVEQG